MINTLRSEYDHLLASPFLTKKDDPGVPMIECTIGQRIFHKTFCDIGLGVNIMSKVMYEYLFGDEPLLPTYMQLQMADQSIRFPDGIAKDVIIRIHDQYTPTDLMVLDMGEEEDGIPSSLEDRSSTQQTRSSSLDLNKSTSNSLEKRYAAISIVIPLMNIQRRPALGGDVDHPNIKGVNPQRIDGKKMKNLKKL